MGRDDLGDYTRDPEDVKIVRRAFEKPVPNTGKDLGSEVISEEEYRKNKRLIELVRTSNYLDDPNTQTEAKRRYLLGLGYTQTTNAQGDPIPVASASAADVHDQLRAIYYCAERENELYDQRRGSNH